MRKFYDSERNTTITISELIDEYKSNLLSDFENYSQITFEQYLNNCLAKNNGTLYEIKSLTKVEKHRVSQASEKLCNAVKEFCLACDAIDDDSFNAVLSENYPFNDSLDSLFYNISTYHENIVDALENNNLFKLDR